ncbi:hypothetical protein EDB89DRAFT_1915237 [Lactarius sanguifluus]|nr:hypothetical protein EDB89DRAFT_1915237 [Lactarius sanguifluus]
MTFSEDNDQLDTTKFFPITCVPWIQWIVCWATGWNAKAAHLIETLAWVPSAQLVGADNQAAVISDQQNHVFVLKNSGFVAYGVTGSYDVLAIVDQTHFPHAIKDCVSGAILGHSFEVRMTSAMSPRKFVNQGLCRCVISGNYLELLPAGQHCISHPNIMLRRLYTVGECTRNQVPMSLTLYLKRELEEPFKLAAHGAKPSKRPLTEFVLVDYSSMVKQHPIGGDSVEHSESSSQFLDTLRTHTTNDLHTAALEYGTIPQGLSAIHRRDRQHNGQADQVRSGSPGLGHLHANSTLIAPQNVDHENSNKVKHEEGVLSVALINAQARTGRRILDRRGSQGRREVHATQFAVEAVAIRIKVRADAEVADEFAQETNRRRQEIQPIAAFGHKAVFVPTEVMDVASQVLAGMMAGVGVDSRT